MLVKKVAPASRVLLGLIYLVFGLNGFLNFLPQPPLPEGAMTFLGGLFSSGYFFPVLKGTEVVSGALLLAGVFSPLALIILAPVTLQILLFHAFLTPGLQNSVLPIAMIVLHVVAATAYWQLYQPLFSLKPNAREAALGAQGSEAQSA
ncbi:MAG: acyltransferase [Bdellovibrionaceae bacterium]|nr:acyltransferase [Pseudobdellovibrionaceae bacterium]